MYFKQTKQGFTLIELLVVVLIIGILAAVALPQYQKSVEKSIMTEAVTNVREIAKAHELYYLANNKYLSDGDDLQELDISISGLELITSGSMRGRYKSKHFVYAPNAYGSVYLAHARRYISSTEDTLYSIAVLQSSPSKIVCSQLADATDIQKQLCRELNQGYY